MKQCTMALAVVVALTLVATGCKKPRKVVLSKDQRESITENLLESAPTPQRAVGAVLDDKIRLIGLDIKPTTVRAGESVEVTWYWESLADQEGDWKIFVHFEVPGKRRTTHDHQAMGELYPISKWKKGEIIRDVQRIDLAKDFPAGTAHFNVGIFDEKAWSERQANVRMKVTNPGEVKVPIDGDGRIDAGTVTITAAAGAASGASRAAEPKERVHTATRVEVPPVIDGKLDDPAWRGARPTAPFVQPGGGVLSPRRLTQARLAWDDKALYVGFVVRDDDIWNDQTGRDTTLWEQDVVEIYLDPGSDGKDYVEIQVSPTGEIFDAHFVTHRKPAWPEAAKSLDIKGMQAKVAAMGSVNARDDEVLDQSWSVEVSIPWAELPGVDAAPAQGTTWGVNFYRIDGKTPHRGGFMSAWSPAGGDFHNAAGFGKVTFGGASVAPRTRLPTGVMPRVVGAQAGEEPEAEEPAEEPAEAPGEKAATKPAATP